MAPVGHQTHTKVGPFGRCSEGLPRQEESGSCTELGISSIFQLVYHDTDLLGEAM